MFKRILISLMCSFMLVLTIAPAGIAFAGTVNTPIIPKPDFLPGPDPESTASGETTQDFILNQGIPTAINVGIGLLGLAAFIGILIASITMLTAYGNEDKYNRAKEALRYSIYGFLIVILSYAIVAIVVALALPSESANLLPRAYAVDVENDVNILFPSEREIIEQDPSRGVSLPSGDFITEIVPAAITNLFYFIGLLLFLAIMVAGILLISGRGNEEMVTKAKRIMTYSAIAIALISLGYALIFGIATLTLNQDETSTTDDIFVETSHP